MQLDDYDFRPITGVTFPVTLKASGVYKVVVQGDSLTMTEANGSAQ